MSNIFSFHFRVKWGELIVRGPRNLGVLCNGRDGLILGGELFLLSAVRMGNDDNLWAVFDTLTDNNTVVDISFFNT